MKTEILPVHSPSGAPSYLAKALEVIKSGGLVVFPTDTVYGLASSAFNPQAIEQLFVVKGRDSTKAIAILIGDLQHLSKVAMKMEKTAIRLAEHFWPGPLTLIVQRHPMLPDILAPTEPGTLPTIGIRMPDHAVALALLKAAGPLAVTSANSSGKDNACTAQEVYDQLGETIPLILDGGQTPGGVPSTVVDCTIEKPQILRHGPISQSQIEKVLFRELNLS